MLSGVWYVVCCARLCGEQGVVRGEQPIPLGGELGVELTELREVREAVAAQHAAQRERRAQGRAAGWAHARARCWRPRRGYTDHSCPWNAYVTYCK